jgi:hypothetical protein
MKLCQKCRNAIDDAGYIPIHAIPPEFDLNLATESDCEFWAHKLLNMAEKVIRDEFGAGMDFEEFLRDRVRCL